MPLDQGASAPLSRHADRLARLKILRLKANREQRKQRRFSKARLRVAEHLLIDIMDGADLIGEGPVETRGWSSGSGVYLLVMLPQRIFDQLCEVGAELEDDEDTQDREPTDADDGEVDDYAQPSLTMATGGDYSVGLPDLIDTEGDGELVGSGCTDAPAKAGDRL